MQPAGTPGATQGSGGSGQAIDIAITEPEKVSQLPVKVGNSANKKDSFRDETNTLSAYRAGFESVNQFIFFVALLVVVGIGLVGKTALHRVQRPLVLATRELGPAVLTRHCIRAGERPATLWTVERR